MNRIILRFASKSEFPTEVAEDIGAQTNCNTKQCQQHSHLLTRTFTESTPKWWTKCNFRKLQIMATVHGIVKINKIQKLKLKPTANKNPFYPHSYLSSTHSLFLCVCVCVFCSSVENLTDANKQIALRSLAFHSPHSRKIFPFEFTSQNPV